MSDILTADNVSSFAKDNAQVCDDRLLPLIRDIVDERKIGKVPSSQLVVEVVRSPQFIQASYSASFELCLCFV